MNKVRKGYRVVDRRFLEVKEELLELLQDPAVLTPVRRFCQILWQGLKGDLEAAATCSVILKVIAKGDFPEKLLEARSAAYEKRRRDREVRRRLLKAV
ncbi:MAG: hypothetical protein M1438_18680 [Deltaproteobacteria bacterium]|nr:hypothetical protein [Deltaproteobacteria bacterium]